jgi:capsular polysaccharide transport system ATP-binding protein
MIQLERIYKTYSTNMGPNVVLDGISIAFPPRESIGILGRNGAGKSTLLRIIGGVERPDSGEVVRTGRVSWPIGFAGGFNPTLSGEENCRFVARIYGENTDRVVGSARDFAELGNYFCMPVRTYSSGMRARLAFGLSMAIDFDVYLVDEVTAVGDEQFQEKSVIIVSHNLTTIRSYCTRCAVLRRGTLEIFDSVTEAAHVYSEVAA